MLGCAISTIEHPNIIKIYDFSGSDSRDLWIVTEILHGSNLAEFIHRSPYHRLHPIVCALVVRELCKALGKAHSLNIIHRDVKPENVMVRDDGRIKLMDFGIARDSSKSRMTITGTFMGSPSYMSPEQVRGKEIDPRSDIYSLGVLFYETVTGALPYVGASIPEVIAKILQNKPVRAIELVPGLPPSIDDMIAKAMASSPAERYVGAQELGKAIDEELSNYGFAESHIELERYFSDRRRFEARLDGLDISKRMRSQTRKGRRPPPVPRRSSKEEARRKIPTPGTLIISASHPSTMASRTSPPNQRHQADRRRASRVESLKAEGPSRPKPPSAAQASHPPRPVSELRASARRSDWRVWPKRRIQPGRPAMIFQPAWMRPTVAPTVRQSSGGLQRFLGVMLAFGVVALSMWAFIQVARHIIRSHTEEAVTQTKTDVREGARSPTSARIVGTTNGPAAVRIQHRGTSATATPEAIAVAKGIQERSPRDDQRGRSQPRNRNLPNPWAQARNGGQSKMTPTPQPSRMPNKRGDKALVGTAGKRRPVPSSLESTEAREQPGATKSRVTFAVQPAAEIVLDGRVMGTTNDAGIVNHGLTLPLGRYRVELRRNGFESFLLIVNVKAGEEQRVSAALKPVSKSIPLIIRTMKVPATLQILSSADAGDMQELTLTKAVTTVPLQPGIYKVKAQYSDQVIQRTINLDAGEAGLTFNADFW